MYEVVIVTWHEFVENGLSNVVKAVSEKPKWSREDACELDGFMDIILETFH
jgi:hypothetical protein